MNGLVFFYDNQSHIIIRNTFYSLPFWGLGGLASLNLTCLLSVVVIKDDLTDTH